MEPVAHILEYYETFLSTADAADWPHTRLRERVQHYRTINGLSSWTPRPDLRPQHQHEIPFDPPYRMLNRLEQLLKNKL